MFNYQKALKDGATEDQVIEYLTKTRKFDVQGAIKDGASKNQIIDYLANSQKFAMPVKQEQPDDSLRIPFVTTAMEKASKFLFGTSAKTVGKLGYTVKEGFDELSGKKVENRKGYDVAGRGEESTPGAVDSVFTALELYPGGGLVTGFLKKLPYGAKIAKNLNSLPDKLKASAIKKYSEALSATTKKLKKKSDKVVPELLERGETIKTMEGFEQKALANVDEAGEAIRTAENAILPAAKSDITPVISNLDNMRTRYIVDNKIIDEKAVRAIDDTKNILSQFESTEIPTNSLIKIRRILDKSVATANQGFTKDEGLTLLTEAREEMANNIRKVIAADVPDLAKANKEYSLWKNVHEIVKATNERKRSQTGILQKVISTGAGGTIGAMQGDSWDDRLKNGAIGAFLGANALKLLQSPAYKTISAQKKKQLADLIAGGKFKDADIYAIKLLGGLKNSIENNKE